MSLKMFSSKPFRAVWCDYVNWIHGTEWGPVNMLMDLQIPQKLGISFLAQQISTFQRKSLHNWGNQLVCYEGYRHSWHIVAGSSIQAQSRADLCQMLFNSTLSTQFISLSQHIEPPGIAIYSSGTCTVVINWRNMNLMWIDILCYESLVVC